MQPSRSRGCSQTNTIPPSPRDPRDTIHRDKLHIKKSGDALDTTNSFREVPPTIIQARIASPNRFSGKNTGPLARAEQLGVFRDVLPDTRRRPADERLEIVGQPVMPVVDHLST